MTWVTPTHTFTCGACGTRVTGIPYVSDAIKVMTAHDQCCKGFAPTYHETNGDRTDESRATEAGVTPGETTRVAAESSSGRGDYQIALRDDSMGLDDVVVKDVEMFRMERMDDDYVWLCCYLNDGQSIHFDMHRKGKTIVYSAREPLPAVQYEEVANA